MDMDARTLEARVDPASGSFEPQLGRSVSIEHAMQLLRVSRRTVYNWIREGRLVTIRTLGGSQRVVVNSLRPHVGRRRDSCALPPTA